MIRLYWLGFATEGGAWALDTGPGTKTLRVDNPAFTIGAVTRVNEDLSDTRRPRGWLELRVPAELTFTFYNQGKAVTVAKSGIFSTKELIAQFGVIL